MTNYLFFMSDLHSAGLVASFSGMPIRALREHKRLRKILKKSLEVKGLNDNMLDRAQVSAAIVPRMMRTK
jgi:predicted ATP-grasp superfamily ATP-dependent carboligase